MINIKRLKRPTKRSGYKLESGGRTFIRGVYIINQNKFAVFIDRYTPKKKRKAGRG